ncbi:MAG: molybdopterin-binding protein, partial [Ruegeria sp.]
LRQPGEALGPGQIYNSNRFMMVAALRQPWIRMTVLGAVEDDPDRLRETLDQASRQSDLIVTTGVVSVGEEDHMTTQLRRAGGHVEVMKIAMKPGKPLTVGTLSKAVFIGLPGNPVAAFTTWKIFGQTVARRMSGQRAQANSAGRGDRNFLPVPRSAGIPACADRGHIGDRRPRIELLDRGFSAKISLICHSDGLAVIPAGAPQVATGARLEFIPL